MKYKFRNPVPHTVAALVLGLAAVTPAQAQAASCDGPIKLGTTISSTGRNATLADRWVRMTEVFEARFNKEGGVFVKECDKKLPIKFVIYDDQSVPATAVTLYERLATADKVDFFVGPDWSALSFAASQVMETHKIPSVMSNASAENIYTRGLKYAFGVPMPTAKQWSVNYLDLLKTVSPAPKSIFFVTQDNLLTKDITNNAVEQVKAAGMEVVGNEIFAPDLKDFTAITLKLRRAKPDVIYISSYDAPAMPLIQQMRQMRVKAQDVHLTMTTGALLKTLGKDAEGLSGEIPWFPGMQGDYSDFVTEVLKEADVDVRDYLWTMSRLSSYLVMVQAIERAGAVDREKVRNVLDHGTFKSPVGDITFLDGGISETAAFTTQVQQGSLELVAPKDVANKPFIYPSESWK